jgi:membrane protease YdiL (CAAX protease family)
MNQNAVSKRVLVETVIIMLITFSSVFISSVFLKYLLEAPAFLYLIIEMFLRHRSPRDIGFKIAQTPSDLIKNLPLLFIVTIVFQIVPLLIGKYLMPSYIEHLHDRMSFAIQINSMKSIIVLIVTFIITSLVCFYEELIYRGFFIERLSWFTKPYFAIGISTIIFACMHFTPGNPSAVIFDIISVLLDGIIYGIIYFRTKNIFTSFTAHVLVDIFDIILFRMMF